MANLKILSGVEICKILERDGFQKIRQHGSHIVMQKKINNSTITVPVPNLKEVRIGTLRSITRQSGIPKAEFES